VDVRGVEFHAITPARRFSKPLSDLTARSWGQCTPLEKRCRPEDAAGRELFPAIGIAEGPTEGEDGVAIARSTAQLAGKGADASPDYGPGPR